MSEDAKAANLLSHNFVPVYAIGASAGGVVALQALLRQLPCNLGLAYVVIVHLSPDQPSALSEILAACTRMPVLQIQDGPTLKPNCVYVIPPDRELVIEGDSVTARAFSEPRGRRAPIDMFFRSVAAARGDGIAVVLSGAGADGAGGVRAVKEAGGVIMVQEPSEAGFASMPQNALATGAADFVAPIARLAERIAEVARSKEAVRSLDMDGSANDLRRIVAFLRARTGHDFSSYKRATVMRRVLRRMQVCRTDTLRAYSDYLLTTPEETKELFSDLLISVTMFFRDPRAYEALARQAVKPLFDDLDPGKDEGIRAWVVGCATGEEAYSIAMLMHEEAARRKVYPQIHVFATDLDEGALATAREGRYPRSIEADVSDERLARFFVEEGTHYRVRKELRETVLFASHSVIKEPPFMRLDLITCRNLLIYLERFLQQQLCSIFQYALKPGRFLFLGSAETADVAADLFAPLDREARIYCARARATQALPILPQFAAPERPAVPGFPPVARIERAEPPAAVHASALERTAPPSALVDDGQNILHLSPSAGRFVLHSAGPISSELSAVVRPELRLDLRLALTRAIDRRESTLTHPAIVAFDGVARRVAMHVAPVPNGAQVLVLFLDGGVVTEGEEPEAGSDTRPDEVRRLHTELKSGQEALVESRSGHEAAIQDLRATNEELQSINEEYRSTAEELETSKEELQSINEELHTVNAELKSKLTSISAAHSDLQNLTAATEIGTLFLDLDLRIRMFTPPIAELFSVTRADIGRTITDFTNRLDYAGMEQDARRVLRDLAPVEREVRSRNGQWYVVRQRPYRTVEDRIDGTVVTFVDITARRQAEAALRESEERLRLIVDGVRDYAIFTTDTEGRITDWLPGAAVVFGWTAEEIVGQSVAVLFTPEDRERGEVERELATARDGGIAPDIRWHVRRDGSRVFIEGSVRALRDAEGRTLKLLNIGQDVTERYAVEDRVRVSEARFRGFAENSVDVLWIADNTGARLEYLSPAFERVFGGPRDAVLADRGRWRDLVHPDDRNAAESFMLRALAGQVAVANYRVIRPVDGRVVHLRDTGFLISDEHGATTQVAGIVQDVTDLVDAGAALEAEKERFRTLVEGIPQLVWRAGNSGAWSWVSPQWQAFTGLSQAESLGQGWLAAVHPEDREGALSKWREADRTASLEAEYRVRNAKRNQYRWLQTRATPVSDGRGGIAEWLGASADIDDLRRLQNEQTVLVAELQHRTRNLIAVVRSIASQTMRATDSVAEFRHSFENRLGALGRVQGLLSQSDHAPVTIRSLVEMELDALGTSAEDRIVLAGPEVPLRRSIVQTFALALHELATNARKYGALGPGNGRLQVTWALADAPEREARLRLEWLEEGLERRPQGTSSAAGGYGRKLIEQALPYALDAETTYELDDGTLRCTIEIPLNNRNEDAL